MKQFVLEIRIPILKFHFRVAYLVRCMQVLALKVQREPSKSQVVKKVPTIFLSVLLFIWLLSLNINQNVFTNGVT